MGEKRNPSHTHQVRLFYHELSYVRLFLMIQVQILVDELHRGHLASYDVIWQILANNSRLKRPRDMVVVSLCLYRHDAWTYMQHDLLGLTFNLKWTWPEVKRWPVLFKVTMYIYCIWFKAPWRKEHAGPRIKPLAYLVQKFFAKKVYGKTAILSFYP